jgi:hypothetical protein
MSNYKFDIRWLKESDYPELLQWWKDFRFPAPPQSMLPDNGTCGVMISKGDINVCAGFLYFTNSSVAMCEFVVSNFQYKDKDRTEALSLLYAAIESAAKEQGYKLLFSTVKNEALINRMLSFGWSKGSVSTEMIKGIK